MNESINNFQLSFLEYFSEGFGGVISSGNKMFDLYTRIYNKNEWIIDWEYLSGLVRDYFLGLLFGTTFWDSFWKHFLIFWIFGLVSLSCICINQKSLYNKKTMTNMLSDKWKKIQKCQHVKDFISSQFGEHYSCAFLIV